MVIYAHTADEIQPAIDRLAENNEDGRGGVVQLLPKTYYPETTIWLKSGVTLQGARRSRKVGTLHRDPDVDEFRQPKQSTVISTAEMDRGADAFTYEHDVEAPHPHFPLIAAYNMPPVEDGRPTDRDPTAEELSMWGTDIGLRNVILDGSENARWWDYSEHGSHSIYNASKDIDGVDMSDRDWATYFGVYDATIFERTAEVWTENVETRGFLGYGGFWQDARNSLDTGGLWRGGATDYHGSAYTLDADHGREQATYTTGIWDFSAAGPRPAVEFGGHGVNKFPSLRSLPSNRSAGSPPANVITGKDNRFLGDEGRFNDGDVPLVNPDWADVALVEDDQRTIMTGYRIRTAGNTKRGTGFLSRDAQTIVRNLDVAGCDTGIDTAGNRTQLHNVRVSNCTTGINCHNIMPAVDGATIRNCAAAVSFSRADPEAPLNGVTIQHTDTFIGSDHNKGALFNFPYFYDVNSFGQDFPGLRINMAGGEIDDITGFPERHKPN